MAIVPIETQQSRALVAQLKRSRIFCDYGNAFRETTGLPIALRSLEGLDLSHHGDSKESPLCALMAQANGSCAACLQLQRQVEDAAQLEVNTRKCFAGLWESAVPVRVGEELVGFLQTGQVLLAKPDEREYMRTATRVAELGGSIDEQRLKDAYAQTRVFTRKQYESVLRLLSIFAEHLSVLTNQLMVEGAAAEMPSIAKARSLIAERCAEQLSLPEVARAVNMNTFYFCKSFRKVTGMTFTTYLARVRVEKVKNQLLDPNCRISEAAYEAGFQSLSQFNRVFHRIAGESPTAYRGRLHGRI